MNMDEQVVPILARRSIRVYSPGAVTQEQTDLLLKAAMAAPSAMAKDPWRFIVIENAETLKDLAAALPGGAMLNTAAQAVIVCGDVEACFERNIGYLLQDCSAAIENLLIAAQAIGLGACWVGVYPFENGVAKVRAMTNLPLSMIPIAVISLGLPGEKPEPRTRYCADYVRRERW